jgi:2-polyprenyl-3-methyl-5-hydroxy-6-metoxy-1,4-benzoquinol methylase
MQESVQLPQDNLKRMYVKPVVWTHHLVTRFWDGVAQTRLSEMSFGAISGEECLQVFSPFLDKSKSYIDFGGGDGHFAKLLCAQGYRVAIYDISEGRTQHAMEALSEYTGTFLGHVLPGSGQKFAGAFFLEVAEHVLDGEITSTYQQIYDLLEPGGLLFLTTPNQEDLELGCTVEPQSGALYHRWQHVRSFNRDTLAAMLKPFGFNELLIHEIEFKKEIFVVVNKATAGVGNIFAAKRPVYFENSRANLAGVFSKGVSSFKVDKTPCNVSMTAVASVSPDLLLGAPDGWPAITLPTAWITQEGGSCFTCALDTVDRWDDEDHPAASMLRLYEDGLQLGPSHASLDEIHRSGAGLYAHWKGSLYFSSSDGSDPRVNGRRYEVRAPDMPLGAPNDWPTITVPTAWVTQEGGSRFACRLDGVAPWDDVDHPVASVIRLYEDGLQLGPPHASLDEIQRSGAGRYSHWEGTLHFSSSDGSDPRTNGRRYEVRAPGLDTALDPKGWPSMTLQTASITQEGGSCFVCDLETIELQDDVDHPTASVIRLYEDGLQLGPPHASHDEIRRSGGGRYSHWMGRLYFSSSDGSDPRVNGRRYEVRAPVRTRG